RGTGARLYGAGQPTTASDTLVLTATGLLPNQPALLFQGDNAVAGGVGIAFGDGLRCAGANVKRVRVLFPDASGEASYPAAGQPSIASVVQAQPGDVRRYQVWYRDPIASPCSNGFNLTNGLEVV